VWWYELHPLHLITAATLSCESRKPKMCVNITSAFNANYKIAVLLHASYYIDSFIKSSGESNKWTVMSEHVFKACTHDLRWSRQHRWCSGQSQNKFASSILDLKVRNGKSVWRCDNVGGLGEHVTCQMFWFLTTPCYFILPRSFILRSLRANAHRWTDFDGQYVIHTTCFRARRCLLKADKTAHLRVN